MALTNGQKIFWGITALTVIAGGTGLYLWLKPPSTKDNGQHPNLDNAGNLIDATKDQDGNVISPYTPPSSGGGLSTIWGDDSFPLKRGSKGDRVKTIQRKAGFTGADLDGKLGKDTEHFIIVQGYHLPLSESDFKTMTGTSSSTTTTTTTTPPSSTAGAGVAKVGSTLIAKQEIFVYKDAAGTKLTGTWGGWYSFPKGTRVGKITGGIGSTKWKVENWSASSDNLPSDVTTFYITPIPSMYTIS